jgi:hypothetical protein
LSCSVVTPPNLVVVVGGVTCDHLEYGTVHAVKYNDA